MKQTYLSGNPLDLALWRLQRSSAIFVMILVIVHLILQFIVFNSDADLKYLQQKLLHQNHEITITKVPNDMFAGAALNYGRLYATGEYCFRVDDDDYYDSNYIIDMHLQARSVGARLFGRPPVPILIAGNEEVYVRDAGQSLCIVPMQLLRSGKIWLGGNTISGETEYLSCNHYDDRSFGAADTAMVLSILQEEGDFVAFMDEFNVVAERRSDLHSHTWKVSEESLKRDRIKFNSLEDLCI